MNTLKNALYILCISTLFCGCSINDDVSPENQEEDLELLQELLTEITMMADEPCTDETE